MRFIIRGNTTITEPMKNHVESKVGKIEKYFPNGLDATVHVNVKVHSSTQKVEITIKTPSDLVFRVEEATEDFYQSVNFSLDKLERQVRKHKTKINRKDKHINLDSFFHQGVEEEVEEEFEIIRKKKFSLKPMNPEEAVLQMEMLGHSFFVFLDSETDETSVVYKRKDNSYGLIET